MSAQPYAATTRPTRGSRGGGIVLVILGSIFALIAFGLLAGGGVLMWAGQTQRDAAGYLTSPSTRLESTSYAIAATDVNVTIDALLLRDEYPPFRLDMGGEETLGDPNMATPAPQGSQGYPQPHGI